MFLSRFEDIKSSSASKSSKYLIAELSNFPFLFGGFILGVDIVGINPKNKDGEFFSLNWWYWTPIWGLVYILCHDFLKEEMEIEIEDEDGNKETRKYYKFQVGLYNDGFLIEQEDAEKIGRRVLEFLHGKDDVEAIFNALTCKFEKKKKEIEEFLPPGYHLDRKLVEKWANFCLNCGGFRVY